MAGVSLLKKSWGTKRVLGSKSGSPGRRPLASLRFFKKGRELWVWEPGGRTPSGSSLGMVVASSTLAEDLEELALPGVNSLDAWIGVLMRREVGADEGVIRGLAGALTTDDEFSSTLQGELSHIMTHETPPYAAFFWPMAVMAKAMVGFENG